MPAPRVLRSAAATDRYAVQKTLGQGGMATVYLARDRDLDRLVALKVLSSHLAGDEAFRERFLREARLAARLVHPNIVQVYDVGEDERGPYIVMEYVAGETLADELRRRGRLPPEEVVAIGIQLCGALEAAHAERLVHRDIKPQNVLRRADGQVKLADFGVARSLAATSQTEIGTILGTAAYLAPEQARGEAVTASADLYALGVLLYELLTGKTPFPADTLPEVLLLKESGHAMPPQALAPGISEALDAAVMECLAYDPQQRPASAAILAAQLADGAARPVSEPLPEPASTHATRVLPADTATTPLRRSASPEAPSRYVARNRRRVAFAAGAGLLAIVLAIALAESDTGHVAAKGNGARTTHHATTTTTTTTRAVTASRTTAHQVVPTTPQQAVASLRAALFGLEQRGQLDSGVANDLNQRLDDISQSLAQGNTNDVTHKTDDLVRHVSDLARAGQITGSALAAVNAPLQRLAALVAALPEPTTPTHPGEAPKPPGKHPGPGKHKGSGKHKGP